MARAAAGAVAAARGERPADLSLVVIGNVDAGKSTTAGALLSLCGAAGAGEDALARLARECEAAGKASFKYAWLMDRFAAERARGLTIDLSRARLRTPAGGRAVTLIDAPGHRDFVKNMIRGASQADAALLVVPAAAGAFEAAVSGEGMAREHALLAFVLGVRQVVVAVNKMDAARYDEARFEEVRAACVRLLGKAGFRVDSEASPVHVVPVSGWVGDNLVERSPNMPWYRGPTLVEALDQLREPARPTGLALRLPVQDVYRVGGVGTIVIGRVETGAVRPGMLVAFGPAGPCVTTPSVMVNGESRAEARAGDIAGVHAKSCSVKDIHRGDVASDAANDPCTDTESFEAQVIVLRHKSVRRGYAPVLDCHTSHVACRFEEISSRVDRASGAVLEEHPAALATGDAGIVTLRPLRPMVVERFKAYPPLGRFAVRDSRATVAVGVVNAVTRKTTAAFQNFSKYYGHGGGGHAAATAGRGGGGGGGDGGGGAGAGGGGGEGGGGGGGGGENVGEGGGGGR